jgi:hypothetical protein
MSDVIEKNELNEGLSRVTETYRNPCVQHKREEKQTRKKYCMFSNTIYCVVSTFTNQTLRFRRKTCCTTMCTQYNHIHSHINTSLSTTDHLPKTMCYASSEVLPAVLMCIQGFWNVTVQEERLLYAEDEGTVRLWNVRNHTASNTVSHPRRLESSSNIALYYFINDNLWLSPTHKMEAAGTAVMLALTHQTAQHNSPEDSNTHSLCCENLTPHIIYDLKLNLKIIFT